MNPYWPTIERAKASPATEASTMVPGIRVEVGDVGFADLERSAFVLRVRGAVVEFVAWGEGYVQREFSDAREAWLWSAARADRAAVSTDRDIYPLGGGPYPAFLNRD